MDYGDAKEIVWLFREGGDGESRLLHWETQYRQVAADCAVIELPPQLSEGLCLNMRQQSSGCLESV